MLEIERKAVYSESRQELENMLARLNNMNLEILNISIPSDEMNRLYSLKSALDSLRKLIVGKIDATVKSN